MRSKTLCAAAACGLLIAACGSGSGRHSGGRNTAYGPKGSPYAMSKCMRANGLTRFPDPVQGSGGVGFPGGVTESIEGDLTVDGVSFSGPALKQAEKACAAYLPPAGGPPKLSAQQQRQELALAKCMRAHGDPSFPDPGSAPHVGSGNKQQVTLPGSGSPAFNHAVQVCNRSGHAGFKVSGSNVRGP